MLYLICESCRYTDKILDQPTQFRGDVRLHFKVWFCFAFRRRLSTRTSKPQDIQKTALAWWSINTNEAKLKLLSATQWGLMGWWHCYRLESGQQPNSHHLQCLLSLLIWSKVHYLICILYAFSFALSLVNSPRQFGMDSSTAPSVKWDRLFKLLFRYWFLR